LNRRRASAAVSGIIARAVSSVMNAGGLYVLGGRKSCPPVSGPLFSRPASRVPTGGKRAWFRAAGAGGDGEERVRQHRERDVPVPGAVLADLVVVQPGLVLGLGEAVLYRPPGARYGDEFGQSPAARRVAQEIGQLELAFLARAQGPADQQAVIRQRGARQRPVIQPRALGPRGGPTSEPDRTLRRIRVGQRGCPGRGPAGPLACVPVRPEPARDRGQDGESPGRAALGDGDLRVRKSLSNGQDQSAGHRGMNAM
jgi:hypothetical protein